MSKRRRRRGNIYNTKLLEASREVNSLSEFFVMMQYESSTESAYCGVLSKCRRQETPGLGTMAVTVNRDKGFTLMYDPVFNDLVRNTENWDVVRMILIHEFIHLQDNHVERSLLKWKVEDKETFKKINPIAIDFACNSTGISWDLYSLEQLLSGKPNVVSEDGSIVYDDKGRAVGQWRGVYPTEEPFNLPPNLSYERYYSILKKIDAGIPPKSWDTPKDKAGSQEESDTSGNGEDQGEPDSDGKGKHEDRLKACQDILNKTGQNSKKMFVHIEDFDLESASEEDIESMVQECERISENLNSSLLGELKSRGLGGGKLAQHIKTKLAPPQIPWSYFLKQFVKKASLKKNKKKSIRNQNKRREDNGMWSPFPGKTHDKKVKALVVFDTSASMTDSEFNEIRNEVLALHSMLGDITVIYCDTIIQHIEKLTANSKVPDQAWGRGGTSFDPPFEWVLDTNYNPDILIYGTDGECPLPQQHLRIKIPVLWVVSSRGCLPGSYSKPETNSLHPLEYGSAIKLNKV